MKQFIRSKQGVYNSDGGEKRLKVPQEDHAARAPEAYANPVCTTSLEVALSWEAGSVNNLL
ncbi:MAG: hypothetical protein HA496_08130 [Thaumarchaeota archaeon]|nr:hypothetical protein [Nitrososphaerota archaeon]